MDDHEFPRPVAVLTIVIAGLVLFWQRLSDRLSPGAIASAVAEAPQTRHLCAASRHPGHPHTYV
jgi:hypothetical protein